jgi:hypothetical protein
MSMKRIAVFLILLAVLLGAGVAVIHLDVNSLQPTFALPLLCVLIGGIGGCAYCLRAVYLNACVEQRWDNTWQPWYYIRPFVSMIFGGVSFLFLKGGLLFLDSQHQPDSSNLGFLALAFVAGLNVDRFMARIEEIACSIWGIRPSRTTETSQSSDKNS